MGGKLHLKLHIGSRQIATKYYEGKVNSTLEREREREREGEVLTVMFELSASYLNASWWIVGLRMARIGEQGQFRAGPLIWGPAQTNPKQGR